MAKKRKSDGKKKNVRKKDKVEVVMSEFKEGDLHSGSKKGPKVKSRKQALAIALSYGKKKKRSNRKKPV